MFLVFIRSCCRPSEKASILLKNSLVFFEEYYDKFYNSYLVNHLSFFFPYYTVNFLSPLSCLLPNYSSLKLCKGKSVLLLRMLQPVFVIVSMTQYLEDFNLQIPYDHICRRSIKIQSHFFKLYFRTSRSSPYNFPFAILVSSKPKQISMKKL